MHSDVNAMDRAKVPPIVMATKGGHTASVAALCEGGGTPCDANALDYSGFPALSYASAVGDTSTVVALCEGGAATDMRW